MKYLTCLLVFTLLFVACNDKENVLPEKKMVDVLYDIQLAEATFLTKPTEFHNKEEKDRLLQGVLQKHNITEAILDSSIYWYSDNPERYQRVTDSVKSRIAAKDKIYKAIGSKLRELASKDLNFSYITNENPVYSFDIDSIALKDLKTAKTFECDILGVSHKSPIETCITFVFSDTTIYVADKIENNTHYEVLNPDSLNRNKLRHVFGYLRIEPKLWNQNILFYHLKIEDKDPGFKPKPNPTTSVQSSFVSRGAI